MSIYLGGIFFWLFEPNTTSMESLVDDSALPLIIWLNGGPVRKHIVEPIHTL